MSSTVVPRTSVPELHGPTLAYPLGGQVDAIPGQDVGTWFRADEVGTYHGQSTAFSGTSYATIRAWVHVVTPQDYQRFIDNKQQQLTKAQDYVAKKLDETTASGPIP